MPFIPSAELTEHLEGPSVSAQDLLVLLSQASDALAFLHSRDLLHLDLKPANILVSSNPTGPPRAIISDFGFAKHFSADTQGRTLVMGTDGYMDPDLLSLMFRPTTSNERRVRDHVPRNELRSQFDRFSFGATILDCITAFLDTRDSDGNPREAPTSLLRGLLFIALRCAGRHPQAMRTHDRYPKRRQVAPESYFRTELADTFQYSTTTDLRDDLLRLQGSRLAYLEPEVAETTRRFVCLPDRVFAPLSPRVVEAIDSAPVRRLATVPQIALCYHVYPGAAHTRKEHVLGVYRTTCRLLRQLILDPSNPIGSMILKAPQQRLAMLSALLHDIAHIPLMAEFEDSVPELSQRALTSELLSGAWGGSAFSNALSALLRTWDVPLDDLRLVLGQRERPPERFGGEGTKKEVKERWERAWERADIQLIRSIIDGSVDADKIDYLQRDALHVGVRFGHGVEAERIEMQITTALETEGSGGTSSLRVRCRMGTWRKGQAAAESLVAVRNSMYSQVYAHRSVRAARAMLNFVVWKWRTGSRYASLDGEAISRELFGFASRLGPERGQGQLLAPLATDIQSAIEPSLTDNLSYSDSRVIRWMAYMSGDAAAIAMAEALISRHLYKKVCSLERSDIERFLRTAFTRKGNLYSPDKFSARHWLSFVDYLKQQLAVFSADPQSLFIQAPDSELPPLLLDIAIPKILRAHSELCVVRDNLAGNITWRRLTRIEGERTGLIPGAIVERSSVYEAYGSSSEEGLSSITIRLYARDDIAPQLRPRIDRRVVSSWIEAFRVSSDEERS